MWIIIFFLFLLLVYSVFFELMLFSPGKGRTYQRGTYSFSRHPGWLWYTGIHTLFAFLYFSPSAVLLMAWCILLNLGVIIIEDVCIFPRLFKDYQEYKKQTRFLV